MAAVIEGTVVPAVAVAVAQRAQSPEVGTDVLSVLADATAGQRIAVEDTEEGTNEGTNEGEARGRGKVQGLDTQTYVHSPVTPRAPPALRA